MKMVFIVGSGPGSKINHLFRIHNTGYHPAGQAVRTVHHSTHRSSRPTLHLLTGQDTALGLLSMPSASVGVPDLSIVQYGLLNLSGEVGTGIFTHPWRLLPAFAVARGGMEKTAVFICI
jgi:hypothetical protein